MKRKYLLPVGTTIVISKGFQLCAHGLTRPHLYLAPTPIKGLSNTFKFVESRDLPRCFRDPPWYSPFRVHFVSLYLPFAKSPILRNLGISTIALAVDAAAILTHHSQVGDKHSREWKPLGLVGVFVVMVNK